MKQISNTPLAWALDGVPFVRWYLRVIKHNISLPDRQQYSLKQATHSQLLLRRLCSKSTGGCLRIELYNHMLVFL